MDSRLDVFAVLGLTPGEAHVIRNAGGVVTEDTIRSLTISQRLLGTEEIIFIHHTGCGMLSFTDDALCSALEAETGARPAWAPGRSCPGSPTGSWRVTGAGERAAARTAPRRGARSIVPRRGAGPTGPGTLRRRARGRADNPAPSAR